MENAEKTELLELADAFFDNQVGMLEATRDALKPALPGAVNLLSNASGRLLCVGLGKSGQIAKKTAATMMSLGTDAAFLHAAEAFHGDFGMVREGDAAIVFSHSGMTPETLRAFRYLKRFGVSVIAVVGNADSPLATEADISLSYRMEKEGSPDDIAPMASTTAMLVVGDLLAASLAAKAGFREREFAERHPGGSLGLRLTPVRDVMLPGDRVPAVGSDVSFKEAVLAITEGGLGVVCVTDGDGCLAGVMTDGDIRRFLQSDRFDPMVPVVEVMTPSPRTVGEEYSLESALRLMEELKIMSLFVTDAGKRPTGVVHMHHIIEGKLL